jgi:hypothetical protein
MTVSAVESGIVKANMELVGIGVQAGTTIVSQLTGASGGIGTYQVSVDYDGTPAVVTSTTINGTL